MSGRGARTVSAVGVVPFPQGTRAAAESGGGVSGASLGVRLACPQKWARSVPSPTHSTSST